MGEDRIQAWKKRLNRKGPFYLLREEPYEDKNNPDKDGMNYVVIWNDKKTRIGSLNDWMWCRYGISTRASLNGDRPHDLWNGQWVSNEEFHAMLEVRNGVSTLPKFDLNTLKNLSW